MRKKSKHITTKKQTNNETQRKAVREKRGQETKETYRKKLTK